MRIVIYCGKVRRRDRSVCAEYFEQLINVKYEMEAIINVEEIEDACVGRIE